MRREVGWLLAMTLAGCSNGLGLSVDLRTDLQPGVEFIAVTVRLVSVAGPPQPTMTAPAVRTSDFYAGRRVAEFSGFVPGTYDVRVELTNADGDVVAARVVSVVVNADYALVVLVSRDCRSVTCPGSSDAPAATTCAGGHCVDPRCVDGSGVAVCGTPECVGDGDCAPRAACSLARCVGGICLYEARDGACGSGEECGIDTGCHASVPPDAGALDAGLPPPDAGTPDGGCVPDCAGRVCGMDARCGSSCGDCGPTATCSAAGTCMCAPDCAGRTCGTDPRCGTSCGTCGAGTMCDATGNCVCAPDCTGLSCGNDPLCGTSCGSCASDEFCSVDHCRVTGARTACVAGTASACTGSRETWMGGLCCVTNVGSCINGDGSYCTDSAEHWTGTLCCVDAPAACSSIGDYLNCIDPGEHWTGSWCCVDFTTRCAAGTPLECGDPLEHWTGGGCCVEGVSACTMGGSASTCSGHWTGNYCCT